MLLVRAKFNILVVLGLFISGCSTPGKNIKFEERIRIVDPETVSDKARDPQTNTTGSPPSKGNSVEYINGTGVFTNPVKSLASVEQPDEGEYTLTFKNTDIRIVIKAVLSDTLDLPYVVDPRVQGNVTLETSGAIGKNALRSTLEALLKTKGYALVASGESYLILPVSDAPRSVSNISQAIPASAGLPGFSVNVLPLQYTLPTEMEKIIEPFSPTGGILLADDSRRIMILAGTSEEVTGMIRAVRTFDIDRMRGMSFGIYSLNYAETEEIITELKELYQGGETEDSSPVQFIPVPRINKIIAVAPSRALLETVSTWVTKLDIGNTTPGRRLYVYQVKNGRAVDMAQTLNMILGTSANGNFGFGAGNNRSGFGQNNRPQRQQRNNTQFNNQALRQNGNDQFGFGQDGARIVPSEENNSLVIMATPSEFGTIEAAIKQIDVTPKQVLVEVTVAEVGLTEELRYGLQWHFDSGNNTVAFGQSASPAQQFPGFSWLYANSSNVSAVLNALESMTDVKVVSSPKILVLNNQSATLQVGDEVPVPTASAVSTTDSNAPIVNTIQYRNTGVLLTVTPRINDGGLIMLDVEQELSNVVETASSGIDAPTIQQRKMTSSIAVQNGSTIALGGLIRTTMSDVKSGVPILKDIPLIGNAFRTTDLVERRTELVVLLTPRVIRNVEETRNAMDYLSREFRNLLAPEDDGTSATSE